jgi:pSer/pThr/pTyr-binding forkhead associated (FHA) protein
MSGSLVLILRVLLALALYLFLCLILWMIWQDLKRAGFQAVRPKVPALRLAVEVRGASPLFRTYTQPEILLGRDPSCELRLEDDAISARHAKFSFHHGQWWIEDLHSHNGTSLNRIKLTTATVLANGDQVQCGKAILYVNLNVETTIPQASIAEEQHD